jgi:phosphatidylglycerophosphate synthase
MISWSGLLFAAGAGVCFALGAGDAPPWEADRTAAVTSWWPAGAGICLVLAAAADLLDGAFARRAGLATNYGAVLDSTLDRFGDAVIFLGCSVYFALVGNVTFVLLSGVALAATVQVSYVKARGENLTSGLGMGFWQRGERFGLLLVASFLGRMPAAICVLAIFPMFTVLLRSLEAKRKLAGPETLLPAQAAALRLAPRWARGSPAWLGLGVAIAVAVFFLPWLDPFFYGLRDPLGALLR